MSQYKNHHTQVQTRTNPLYLLPLHFYGYQLIALTALGVVFFWFSRNEVLDYSLTHYWFNPVTHHFPWKDNVWLDRINHRLLKYLVIAAGAYFLVKGAWQKNPRMVVVAVLMGLGAAAVGILKATSHHSCPWDLLAFGGHAAEYPLLSSVPALSGPGRCFPGGHASSGFMAMAFFFWFYPEKPRLAWFALLCGVLLGLAMGYGQVMRGAHFFSHNLWAGWWVWLVQVAGYFGFSQGIAWFRRER
ncbi:phosphoesterase [Mangrovibacter phragmitis]|jgi:membrane-associated PAP2 superfamily phosphatase|uniref:Phosphoesterase n=1 Tax=Mangrovibacter phragmitis TaxID=1691903 RepID=A0A1B7L0I1_9ENTR|nr:phosphatase PAP2 family protein [Mangrovibacter phragmitis]OAT75715.1 phosphoesterase [Mangrovibacter phragmitis]